MESKKVMEEEEEMWRREIVTSVMRIVSTRLPQRDLISLLLVSPWLYRTLVSYPSIWLNIDLRERTNAGDRLLAALSLCHDALSSLECLNLNGCQKISDSGIEAITSICPKLKVISIYWNSITDKGMQLVAETYQDLEALNITSFTDKAYKKISLLAELRFLDLCGAQNLSDEGLGHIAKCNKLETLNLTCLFGIVGVTDRCLEALSQTCSATLTTLDVNGCIGIKRRSREELLQMFPRLICFKVHS
uniref:F-box domain-containing protein n=1 Tax=Brassica campestris TaxID=3711 RepID=M4CT59_BRACM